MTIDDHLRNIYSIQKQLKKDEIVDKVSQMIKSVDGNEVRGMTEVPMRYLKELDTLLFQLNEFEDKLR